MADFDLFVIGGGSGGVACARRAASYGARVALCEPGRVGGTCVIRGCIPKKLMRYGALFPGHFKAAEGYGWRFDPPRLDWTALIDARDREIERLNGVYIGMLEQAGVELFKAYGRVTGAHEVEVGGTRHSAERILIAVGGKPSLPEQPGIEHAITSDEALENLRERPERLVVIGGGYVAVELACIFHALGVATALLVRREQPLRWLDVDVQQFLTEQMRAHGLDIRGSTPVHHVERAGGRLVVMTGAGPIPADAVLYATGRVPIPNTRGLGLEALGRRHDRERRDPRRHRLSEQRAQHLRGRRLQRSRRLRHRPGPVRPHPGRDRRGPGDRRDPVQRQPARRRLRAGADRGVRHPRGRHGRPERDAGAGAGLTRSRSSAPASGRSCIL